MLTQLYMVCRSEDGKHYYTTIDDRSYAEKNGWCYIQGGLSDDAAHVLVTALSLGFPEGEDDPDDDGKPTCLLRLRESEWPR